MRRALALLGLWVAIGLHAGPLAAQRASEPAIAGEASFARTSRHALAIADRSVEFTATVGMLRLSETGTIKAHLGFISFALDEGAANRPITFVFNGGPGASSAYLNIGGIGPWRLAFAADATAPALGTPLVANDMAWLAFTDLVFVDPIGTGFSQPARVDGAPVANSEFWGVAQDVAWSARFVREYLSQSRRSGAPVILVGESYGGFRVARLAEILPRQYGVGLVGAILVSPVLDFDATFNDDRISPIAAALRLPTLAATAWHHRLIGEANADPADRGRFLNEVESFALETLLPSLALGSVLAPPRREELYLRLSAMTGLSPDSVRRAEGRITREQFAREALASQGRVLGRYDATVTSPAPVGRGDRGDPTLQGLTPVFSDGIQRLLRDHLSADALSNYVVLNGEISNRWDWRTAPRGPVGGVSAVAQLRNGMTLNAAFKLMIAHGLHDLVTPYFASTFIVRHLGLPIDRMNDVTLLTLEGGHMMYLHAEARARLADSVRQFYARAIPGL